MRTSLSRRSFMKGAASALALSGCYQGIAATTGQKAAGTPQEESAPRPNVIFILADDMGPADLGCYGGKIIPTPNIDRLAAEGMRFTQHYAGATVCGPSRSCLMTGQHTGHAFLRGNPGQVAPNSPLRNRPDKVGRTSDFPLCTEDHPRVTLADVFKSAGYRTAVVGKWGLGNPGTPGDPMKVGFDEFFGLATHVDAHTYHPERVWDNGNYVKNEGRKHVHPLYTDRAIDFVTRHQENPFFLYLAYQFPHGPYAAHDSLQEEPFTEKHGLKGEVKVYASQIAQMDRSIGLILKMLEELGIERKTLLVFASDNGGGGGLEQLGSTRPFRGRKGDLYEGGIRTPMIARWPDRIESGTTSDLVSAFWDFMPTVAELTGQEIPSQTDGVSLLPVMLGTSSASRPDAKPIYFEWSRTDRAGQALRRGDWKLIRWLKGKSPTLELYNLKDDIAEERSRVSSQPGLVKELTALMDREHVKNEHFPMPYID